MLRAVLGLRVLLPALLLVAVTAPQASAAPRGVVVAQAGDAALRAGDRDGRVCVSLGDRIDLGEGCLDDGEPSAATAAPFAGSSSRPKAVGAVVPAAATRVEVRRAGVVLATAPTVAGEAYRGREAGKVRFALVPLPAGTKDDGLRVRALDAVGTLLAVTSTSYSGELVTQRRALLSGRFPGGRWSITGERHSELASSLADLDNEVVQQCLAVAVQGGRGGSTAGGNCVDGRGGNSILSLFGGGVQSVELCAPRFRLLYGQTTVPLRRVTALLGDGRRVTGRLRTFPAARTTVFVILVPAGDAVRSVRQDGPSRSTTSALGLAPLSVACVNGGTLDSFGVFGPPFPPVVPSPAPVTEVPGSPGFRVADGPDGSLCLALRGRPFSQFGCQVVGPGYGRTVSAVDDFEHPRAIVTALPAEVAAVRLRLRGGRVRTVPTVEAPGYAGRYAGLVRFFALGSADDLDPVSSEDLDGAGRVLHAETSGAEGAPRYGAIRRLAGTAGQPSLWGSTLVVGRSRSTCLALTRGPAPSRDASCATSYSAPITALVSASCVTHRLTIAVVARVGRVELVGLAGRRVPVPLRRGAGLVTLPRDTGATSLVLRRAGHRPTPVLLRAPSGGAQCGWAATAQDRGAAFAGGPSIDVVR